MSYTFSDQLNKLSSLLGDPNSSSDDMFPLAQRKKEINRGELKLALDTMMLKEYATGTVASGEIDIPSDWIGTFKLIVGNYTITNDREISLADYERYYNYAGTPPYHYYWEFSGTRKIKFFGTVNGSTYLWWYFKKPTTELSDLTDTSLFPEEYREASVFYAAATLQNQIGKTEIGARYMNEYFSLANKGRIEAEKHFVDKKIPRPDFGEDDQLTIVDIQGRGYIY